MSAEPADAAPDVAIRAQPPSPKRLSRKVLLAGAAIAAAIVSFAVAAGLSATAPRSAARVEAAAGATTPPQSISEAASQYDASELTRNDANPAATLSEAASSQLAPPQDPAWGDAASGRGQQTSAAPATAPDPETVARASSILFSSAAHPNASGATAQSGNDAHLEARLTPPRSPYELLAGAVIPAALLTGLNSDLPGRVIAQVTAPVYDSIAGAHLLIPQGARLIGAYDNNVHYGDARIVLVWNRLILPNGWSIDLQAMPGADPTGAAGVSDKTDNHLWRLGGAVGLSAIVSVIANNSEANDRSASLSQSVGDAAAQQAAQTGGQIVGRELAVHPTLTVRPGANVRVLVTRDITLRPYIEGRGDAAARTP